MSLSGRHLVVPGDTVLMEPGSLMVCSLRFYPESISRRAKD